MRDAADRLARRWMLKLGNQPEVIYTAIFLTPMERSRLVKRFGTSHPVAVAHHMTIWHFSDGSDSHLETLPVGKTISLKVVGILDDDKAQVALVQPPTGLRPKGGRTPHITLSTEPGVAPAYSNELIARNPRGGFQKGLPSIEGRVGWWDGEKERYDLPA